MRRSPSSISTSSSSGRSGATTTWANAVWRRCAESNGRLADEPVHAPLCLVGAVGVLALDGHRRGLEAGLLARARLDELGLVAAVGRPAQVHAQHHLGPVLRVGAARAGVDRDDGVTGVVLAVEERVLLQSRELGRDGRQLRPQLVLERRVHLEELARLLDLAVQPLVAVEPARDARVLGGDARCLLLVVPESGGAHGGFELFLAGRQLNGVKGTHEPSRAGLRAPRAAAREVGSPGRPPGDPSCGELREQAEASLPAATRSLTIAQQQSHARPTAKPARTSLTKCTLRSTRLAPIASARTAAATSQATARSRESGRSARSSPRAP